MQLPKVLALGIDALDSYLLSKFENQLPNFHKLKEACPTIVSRSVFPPDTPTAWATIYTGLNPAKHGILFFVDPLERVSTLAFRDVDNVPIRGRTFWDFAGNENRKVCILFPELGYPIWPVNGVMIGRTSKTYDDGNQTQVFPPELGKSLDLRRLSRIRVTPKKSALLEHARMHKEVVMAEIDFSLKMLKQIDWDLFFMFSPSLDWVGHNFWAHYDEEDPNYSEDNPYKNILLDFYKLYDEMIGKFKKSTTSDYAFLVFSDHGMGRRPTKLLNINEILRRKGLLISKIKKPRYDDPYFLMTQVKEKITEFLNKYGIGKLAAKVVFTFPFIKRMYTSPPSINWDNTLAYVTDLSGIKAYSYGGIRLQKHVLEKNNLDYEKIRSKLIKELYNVVYRGKKLFKWVSCREQLYSGKFIIKYPDIVFMLEDEYGAGWSTNSPLITKSGTHNLQPGSHRIDTPVFFIYNIDGEFAKEITLMDIAPTILHLLDIDWKKFNFDGVSIFRYLH